jgi:uncharacterized membrane protein YgcG
MEWVLIALVVGGAGLAGGRRWQRSREQAAETRSELEGVRRLAEEDVTVLGEQLRRLDAEVAGRPLDDAARADYQTALDAYESAGRSAPRIGTPEEISRVVDTLSTGRYALACVQARVDGRPVPERRVACFFNPQHGPSVTDVMWTPRRGGGTRRVPACAQDAARVAADEEPEVRMVTLRSRTVPYWAAGSAYQPYGEGYFASAAVMTWAFQTPVDTGSGSWSGPDGWGGFDGGGFDGGFDGGGGGDGGS